MRASVLLFLIVGGCAAATHYLVTLGVDWATGMAPAWSNLVGFLCAFPISYLGHRNLSFAGTQAPHRQALPRLLTVSCTAFVGNQLMLAALLRFTPLPLWIALAIVLVFVALSTWLLGRYWAFAHSPGVKTVYLTADDYGYNAAVDDAVLALMADGRLSGAGCMTRAPGWPAAAARIGAAGGFGLHLDFTEFSPQRRGLWPLIGAAVARRLDAKALRDEIDTQCALFEEATGRAPAYVDGHQHVHQLPQIRETLVEVLVARYAGRLPWLRISGARIGDGAKPLFIAALGAAALERLAFAAHIRTMPRLLGAYGFDGDATGYRQRLSGWLGNAADGDAVMVHPATQALPGDPIGAARVREYGVLASDTLPALLAANAVELGALGA